MNRIVREFAKNLHTQRVRKNISQEKLSLACGFNKKLVGMLERSEQRITLEKVYILAAHLGCSIYDLLPTENPTQIDDMVKLEP
ncbi:helix-turn-helix domain-containing protein [Vibrio parahaemolyticus]|uniref:helix-turn-helix domain-containing protein n=1 Tax=Vibrio harveyi group TaxID=717610 RepID=UPI000E32BD73|nr:MULTISPECIES: helix-turn-helix transcriptional regulator [Vibrio harveyi group]EGU9030326.1 helix-turn-helix domain-containing protein [Vibrio parahaemolyticus]EHJ9976984.1 helix-turn-helix transcriptional regulator [Vibrio parahaemolyticus]EIO4608571.1 helix-turn-helix transcriptional regulator [Vibrio parahaemolyticus]MCS0419328.1 helix-turn-helix transcriptional regulator [Vibrio diabolicus]RFD37665.1 transcriptional regulator [Vibrio parahaemolyticus]